MTKQSKTKDSLMESGLSCVGNPFRTTPLVITFNTISFSDKYKTPDEHTIQSSHHFYYKKGKITTETQRQYSAEPKHSPLHFSI